MVAVVRFMCNASICRLATVFLILCFLNVHVRCLAMIFCILNIYIFILLIFKMIMLNDNFVSVGNDVSFFCSKHLFGVAALFGAFCGIARWFMCCLHLNLCCVGFWFFLLSCVFCMCCVCCVCCLLS